MTSDYNQFNDDSFFDDEALPDEKALIEKARTLELEDRDQEALEVVKRVLKTNANNVDAIILYSQLIPDKQNAEKALNKALRLDPTNVEVKRELKRIQKSPAIKTKIDEFGDNRNDDALQELVRQNQQLMKQMQQPSGQPVINIINENINQNVNQANANGNREGRNQVAFIGGLIGGWIFGLLGIAHIINGKILTGIAYLLIGTAFYWLFWSIIVTITLGIGILLIPLHFVAIWQHSKRGASYI